MISLLKVLLVSVFTLISIQSKTYLVETEEGEPSNEWVEGPDYQLGEADRRPAWDPPPVNGNRQAPRPNDPPPFLQPPVNRGLGENSHGDRGNPPPVNRGLGESSHGDRGSPPPVNRGLGESSHGDLGNPPPVNRGLGESSHGDPGNPPPVNRGLGESSHGDRGNPPPVNRGLGESSHGDL